MAAVKSGMKKIFKNISGSSGSEGSKSETKTETSSKSGGISFGGTEVVEEYDEDETGDVIESFRPNGSGSDQQQSSTSPGTQKKAARVTVSLPEEDKPKKVKRKPTQGTPGSVSLSISNQWGRNTLKTSISCMVCGLYYLWCVTETNLRTFVRDSMFVGVKVNRHVPSVYWE